MSDITSNCNISKSKTNLFGYLKYTSKFQMQMQKMRSTNILYGSSLSCNLTRGLSSSTYYVVHIS